MRLVDAYRRHGHRAARLDPLNLAERPPVAALDPRRYGFALPDGYELAPEYCSEALPPVLPELSDPSRKWATVRRPRRALLIVQAGVIYGTGEEHTVVEVLERLQATYTRSIGVEFMASPNKHEREWVSRLLEEAHLRPVSTEQRLRNFRLLAGSAAFDRFCAKRFPSVKRYSLEGAESMLVALDSIFAYAAGSGVEECVLAMPHRGRLNLLTQLLNFDTGLLVHKVRCGDAICGAVGFSPPPRYADADIARCAARARSRTRCSSAASPATCSPTSSARRRSSTTTTRFASTCCRTLRTSRPSIRSALA